MKIRVYGPCGSGKTYLANQLSIHLAIPLYETDNMIWNRSTNEKFSRDQRNEHLHKILANDTWIIEGAQYKWSFESFDQADVIIFINPHIIRVLNRVTIRFFKMRLGIGKYHYVQSVKELFEMYSQTLDYYRTTKTAFLSKSIHLSHKMISVSDSLLTKDLIHQLKV